MIKRGEDMGKDISRCTPFQWDNGEEHCNLEPDGYNGAVPMVFFFQIFSTRFVLLARGAVLTPLRAKGTSLPQLPQPLETKPGAGKDDVAGVTIHRVEHTVRRHGDTQERLSGTV